MKKYLVTGCLALLRNRPQPAEGEAVGIEALVNSQRITQLLRPYSYSDKLKSAIMV